MTSAWKRICSIGLVLCLLLAALPMMAVALEPEDFADSRDAVVQQLRDGLGAHESEIVLYYQTSEPVTEDFFKGLFTEAVDQTGSVGGDMTYLGDYLVFSVAAVKVDAQYDEQDGMYFYRAAYEITYFNTLEQETVLRDTVAQLNETMYSETDNAYGRCKWIYIQMRTNVAGGSDSTDTIASTAYGALMNGKANSQGIAALFYCLATKAGLDTRIVTGSVNGTPSVWNIVCMYGNWYIVDVNNGLFLRGFGSAKDHLYDDYYVSPQFQMSHVMSEKDFAPSAAMGGALENGQWNYDATTNTLTISGEGAMQDFVAIETPTQLLVTTCPWGAYVDEIKNYVIAEGVTSIGDYAFVGVDPACVVIPATVQVIGRGAFRNSPAKSFTVPEGITEIGADAFRNSALTELYLCKSLTRIGDRAFNGCDNLTTVRYMGDEASWKAVTLAWGNDVIKSNLKNSDGAFFDVDQKDWFYAPVQWAEESGITGGIGNGKFGSTDGCTRAQVVTFLWGAMGRPEPTSTENPFVDVANDAWYAKAVLWAVEQGITGGIAEDRFAPDQTCTRAQIVTFLYAAVGKPAVEGDSAFGDVADDAWYAKPVQWAANNDVTGGIAAGEFGPEDTCTRAQVVTFLYKVFAKAE